MIQTIRLVVEIIGWAVVAVAVITIGDIILVELHELGYRRWVRKSDMVKWPEDEASKSEE